MDEKYFDLLLAAAYTIGAAVGLGFFENTELFGYVLADTATTFGGYDILYHHILSIAGLAGAYLVNKPQWGRLDSVKKGLIGAAVVVLLLSIMSPDTIDSMVSEDWIGLVVLGLQTGGYWGIAHS